MRRQWSHEPKLVFVIAHECCECRSAVVFGRMWRERWSFRFRVFADKATKEESFTCKECFRPERQEGPSDEEADEG